MADVDTWGEENWAEAANDQEQLSSAVGNISITINNEAANKGTENMFWE